MGSVSPQSFRDFVFFFVLALHWPDPCVFPPHKMKVFRIPFLFVCTLFFGAFPRSARAADSPPDPYTVQRFGPAFRYPQAGWTVMHIEGEPYERGVQHGRLLAPEIAGYIRALAAGNKPETAEDGWRLTRTLVSTTFLRRFSREQLLEMQGIADGAAAAGAQYARRPVDLLDIVMINMSPELEAIDLAMSATPTGLEDFRPPVVPMPPRRSLHPRGEHCYAFAANGPATRDGKVVFGHITMYELRQSGYFNIWLDLKPAEGHRFAMQTVPGGIYSSMDYSISDTGIMMGETNIGQTPFDMDGAPLASRVRQVTQYAESIEQAVSIMKGNNNGLGTAEWVLADLKRNEIALLVLGTRESKLYSGNKKEWINGAEGYYWSCDNGKDMTVRLETLASKKSYPASVASDSSSMRDSLGLRLYEQYKGRIDGDTVRNFFTTPALVSSHSVDAVYTTTDLGLQLRSWGCFGPPVGVVRYPSYFERQRFPEIRALVVNPWTVLDAKPPAADPAADQVQAADLHDPVEGGFPGRVDKPSEPPLQPRWHGTLLPAGDGDIWLSNGFAAYHGLVVHEKYLADKALKSGIDSRSMDDLATEFFYYRSIYEQGARMGKEMPLAKVRADYHDEGWYLTSLGKGVLVMHSLRELVGAEKFDALMEEFGRTNGGKAVGSAQFQEFMEKGTGRSWKEFFDAWLNRPGLPMLELGKVETRHDGGRWHTRIAVRRNEQGAPLAVSVTAETADGEVSGMARLERVQDMVELVTDAMPLRVVLDKYRMSACGNGTPFTALTFDNDLENALIVYGTLDEVDANRESARMMQDCLRRREQNIIIPVKADTETTDEDLRNHHLVLLGHPGTNAVVARFRNNFPIRFGTHSFSLRGITYANPETYVVAGVENPLNRRFSMVLYAGLGTRATVRMVPDLEEGNFSYAPLVLVPAGQQSHDMVPVPEEFIREIPPPKGKK